MSLLLRNVAALMVVALLILPVPAQAGAGPEVDEPQEVPAATAEAPTLTIQDLRTPAAPGFVLLGVAPTEIQRPTTPKAFALSLLSSVTASDNLLPSDYAVDVAPYWLTARRGLDYKRWADPSPWQSIQQTFTLSVAASTAAAARAGFDDQTDLSIGARASLLAGRATARTMDLKARHHEYLILDQLLSDARSAVPLENATLARLIAMDPRLEELIVEPDLTPVERAALVAAVRSRLTALRRAISSGIQRNDPMVNILTGLSASTVEEIQDLALAIQKANTRRAGWLIDVAGATAYRLPDQSGGERRRVSAGVWITPGFRTADGRTDLLAAVRVINTTEPVDGTVVDVGARLVHEIQDFVMSLEVLRRTGDVVAGFAGRNRIDAGFDYKLADGFYLSASFGKGFNQTADPANKGGFLGALGLSLGFGEKPSIKNR